MGEEAGGQRSEVRQRIRNLRAYDAKSIIRCGAQGYHFGRLLLDPLQRAFWGITERAAANVMRGPKSAPRAGLLLVEQEKTHGAARGSGLHVGGAPGGDRDHRDFGSVTSTGGAKGARVVAAHELR